MEKDTYTDAAFYAKANEIIDSGKLGQVYEIRLSRNSYHRRNDWQTISEFGGGQLLNWGPHIVDHAIQFCGGDYADMYSNIQHVAAAGDCEDHIKIVFTGVNGRIVGYVVNGLDLKLGSAYYYRKSKYGYRKYYRYSKYSKYSKYSRYARYYTPYRTETQTAEAEKVNADNNNG